MKTRFGVVYLMLVLCLASFPGKTETTADGVGTCNWNPSTGGTIGLGTSVTAAWCVADVAPPNPLDIDSLTFTACGLASGVGFKECDWSAYNSSGNFKGTLWWRYSDLYDEVAGDPSSTQQDCTLIQDDEFAVSHTGAESTSCLNGCAIESRGIFSSGLTYLQRGSYTGGECGGSVPDTTEFTETTDGCIDSGGNEICVSEYNDNCGTFNGQFVCADSVPEGECNFIGGGSFVCSGVPESSPPLPDDGSQGTTAPPDATIEDGTNGTTTNIYSSATVSNSTTTVTNTGGGNGPSGSAADPINVEIDSDAIVDGVVDGLTDAQEINQNSLDGIGDSAVISTDLTDHGIAGFDGVTDDWFGLPAEIDGGTCTDLTWNWTGRTVVIDICSWWVPVREWIGWFNGLLVAIWGFYRVAAISGGRVSFQP